MISLITPISHSEFNRLVSIRFENILDGFDNYINSNLSTTNINSSVNDSNFIEFISKLFELNNNEVILDFFINKLSKYELDSLRNLLISEDKLILDELLKSSTLDTVYFRINNISIIPFFTRLSTHEVFFCTMYFSNLGVTIWGNYNYTFPCFFEKETTLNKLKKIANDYNLNL